MAAYSRNPSKVEAHIRVTFAILNCPAFIALAWSARALYVDMRSKLTSTNNGNINAALTELRHRGWRSPATLAKALRQLEAAGLIAKTRQTIGVERGSKVCNLYRFTDLEVFELPRLQIAAAKATHDYKRFKSLTEARQAMRTASVPKKKRTIQKLPSDATENAPIDRIDASESVVVRLPSSTKSVATSASRTTCKANGHAGFANAQAP